MRFVIGCIAAIILCTSCVKEHYTIYYRAEGDLATQISCFKKSINDYEITVGLKNSKTRTVTIGSFAVLDSAIAFVKNNHFPSRYIEYVKDGYAITGENEKLIRRADLYTQTNESKTPSELCTMYSHSDSLYFVEYDNQYELYTEDRQHIIVLAYDSLAAQEVFDQIVLERSLVVH